MEFRKMVTTTLYAMVTTTLYARQQRDTDVKNRLLDYVEEGEGGTIRENSIETYILLYVK